MAAKKRFFAAAVLKLSNKAKKAPLALQSPTIVQYSQLGEAGDCGGSITPRKRKHVSSECHMCTRLIKLDNMGPV